MNGLWKNRYEIKEEMNMGIEILFLFLWGDIFLMKEKHSKRRMELIDNINKALKNDLITELYSGSKIVIAVSCFSIYAFEELKAQLKAIDELRFIFTSSTFVTEKVDKQKRECFEEIKELKK